MTRETFTHATAIVVAYLARHDVPSAELPALVAEVRAALERELMPADEAEPARKLRPLRPTSDPAVPIAESITPDYLVSLETGQRLKVLEKHLLSFGLTPDAYRERWGLPADYPMAAPRFGAWRSDYGRALGLGRVSRLSAERRRSATVRHAAHADATLSNPALHDRPSALCDRYGLSCRQLPQ